MIMRRRATCSPHWLRQRCGVGRDGVGAVAARQFFPEQRLRK